MGVSFPRAVALGLFVLVVGCRRRHRPHSTGAGLSRVVVPRLLPWWFLMLLCLAMIRFG